VSERVTKKEDLTWRGIELLNKIVLELSNSEACETIAQLRDHMDSRIEQCSTKENYAWE
jgi:hypothetical protein